MWVSCPDVQDGASSKWGLIARDFLNETFLIWRIGRDGPIPWPPRSPDIIPFKFFSCGAMLRTESTPHLLLLVTN